MTVRNSRPSVRALGMNLTILLLPRVSISFKPLFDPQAANKYRTGKSLPLSG
jgi:hypothetical protein